MLIAALGDIHGNLPALEAVLEAIDDAGIHTILNTGDCVAGHPWPNEVVELLRDRDILSAQGETDRLTVLYHRKGAKLKTGDVSEAKLEQIRIAHESLRSANLEFLNSLPRTRTFTLDGITMALCHGTVTSQSESLSADEPEMRFRRQREAIPARIIVCGRSHRGFSRMVGDTLFVNPGSVGMPEDGAPLAQYALINTEEEPWTAELVSVPYSAGSAG